MKKRLHKDKRKEQLLDIANTIIDQSGTDALTLITLAEKAGVTKPVAYNNFGSRKVLLHELFRKSDREIEKQMKLQLSQKPTCLADAITIFITTYFQSVVDQGKIFEATVAALKAYPEYANIDVEIQDFFGRMLQSALQPYLVTEYKIPIVLLIIIFGATESSAFSLLRGLVEFNEIVDNISKMTYLLLEAVEAK